MNDLKHALTNQRLIEYIFFKAMTHLKYIQKIKIYNCRSKAFKMFKLYLGLYTIYSTLPKYYIDIDEKRVP